MALGSVVAPAEGEGFATDLISGTHYPISKVAYGAEGAAPSLVSSSNGLPVAIGKQTGTAKADDQYLPIASVPAHQLRIGFDRVFSNAVDPLQMTLLQTGSGQTVNQSGGSLVITTGTTANAETIIRSLDTVEGSIVMRWSALLSQRIANQNFYIELVDVLGDALSYTLNSSTSMTVTFPTGTNPFTSANVGQGVWVSANSAITAASQRVTLASVSGDTATFTGAGWPASGTGTCDVFGWNYHQCVYNGTSATAMAFDSQRNGWASGATTATISTTASTHVPTFVAADGEVAVFDQPGTSATGLEVTRRGSRVRNVPDADVPLYLQIRVLNGTTAPASTTTFTVGVVDIQHAATQAVTLSNVSPMSANSGLPVEVVGSVAVALSANTPTLAAGTNLAGDVGIQYRASNTGGASFVSVMSPATPAGSSIKGSAGRLVGISVQNSNAALRSLKLFNATAVTMGTTAAAWEFDIPAGGSRDITWPGGIAFGTGMMWAVTGAKGLTDNTAVTLNDVSGVILFA